MNKNVRIVGKLTVRILQQSEMIKMVKIKIVGIILSGFRLSGNLTVRKSTTRTLFPHGKKQVSECHSSIQISIIYVEVNM